MDEELKEKLYKILDELPSENSWLDYKSIPYTNSNEDQAEFIKDLSGFLNSNDSYEEDKYIIIGVSENKATREYVRIGLRDNKMLDDNDYQIFAKNISPSPSFITGEIEYPINSQDKYGYIYIPGYKNKDRIYYINKDVPDLGSYVATIATKLQTVPCVKEDFENYIEELKKMINRKKVYASTAYIRRGSSVDIITEYEQRKIYTENQKPKFDYASFASNYYDISKVDNTNILLKTAILVGGWDETYEGDKQIISELAGQPYNTLVTSLRLMVNDKNSPITYKNEKWQVEDKFNLLKSIVNNYFKDDVLNFQNKVIEILTQSNSKFDVSPEKRSFAYLNDNKSKYSELLKKSVAETLAMISSIEKEFKNDSKSIELLSYNVIKEVFQNADWKQLASLDSVMPLLAEANPKIFIDVLEEKIRKSPETLKQLMSESEIGITTNYYTSGLYWALQLIAWEERYLTSVCVILAHLSNYDKKATDTIAGILLPWFPQTKASIDSRKTAVENVIKENEQCGWNLITELMPNKRTLGSPSYKPKWNNLIIDEKNEVLRSEYDEQIKNYLDIYIAYSKTDVKRLCDLIDLLDDLSKTLFESIILKLSQKNIKKMSENKKYIIWNHLEDFINRHIKFADAKWSLPKEAVNKVKKLADELKPTSKLIYNQRYFIKDSWNLYDDRTDYKKAEKQLHDLRVNIVKEINDMGFDSVVKFVNIVEDSRVIGICYAEIISEKVDEEKVLDYLDSKKEKEVLFAKGFIYKKYAIHGYNWLSNFDIDNWNDNKKSNLLTVLPSNQTTWNLVSKYLNNNEIIYWKTVDIRFVDEKEDVNHPMIKLLEAKRPSKAVGILDFSLRHDKTLEYDRNLAVKALSQILEKQDELNSLDYYHIRDVIKDLQNSNVSKEDLFYIEWAYLNILDVHDDSRPLTIEKEISVNPERYNEILCLAYKKHSVAKEEAEHVDEKIATNAYRLLHQWRIPPGLDENGVINKNKLNEWYNKMKEVCTASDRLEVGLMNFGHVLYYAPKDKSGLWLDKNVAELLNSNDVNAEIIRDAFRTEAYNSLGVVNLDENGTVYDNEANKYEEKAKSIEVAGYSRIATVMRSLADSYRHQAERTRERYYDE